MPGHRGKHVRVILVGLHIVEQSAADRRCVIQVRDCLDPQYSPNIRQNLMAPRLECGSSFSHKHGRPPKTVAAHPLFQSGPSCADRLRSPMAKASWVSRGGVDHGQIRAPARSRWTVHRGNANATIGVGKLPFASIQSASDGSDITRKGHGRFVVGYRVCLQFVATQPVKGPAPQSRARSNAATWHQRPWAAVFPGGARHEQYRHVDAQ